MFQNNLEIALRLIIYILYAYQTIFFKFSIRKMYQKFQFYIQKKIVSIKVNIMQSKDIITCLIMQQQFARKVDDKFFNKPCS